MVPDVGCRHGDDEVRSRLKINRVRQFCEFQSTIGFETDFNLTFRPASMSQFHQNAAGVAGSEEARCRNRNDDRVCDLNVFRRIADSLIRPDNRHQFDRAVEVGQIERRVGGSVFINLDHARIKGHNIFVRRSRRTARAGTIAARPDTPGRSQRSINQAAIHISDFDAKLPLTEVIPGGFRRFETGDIEHTNINGSEGRVSGGTLWQVCDLD